MKHLAEFVALLLFGALPLRAADLSDLTYSTTFFGTVVITGCDEDAAGELIIPDTIGGNPVTRINTRAFRFCSSLTNITIPDGVTDFGDRAFEGCTSLAGITIPDSVTSFGDATFRNCASLTSVTIPDGVTSISYATLYGCASLTSITIPDTVTSIGNGAFRACSNLTSITIPDTVTSIGNRVFYDCSNLTSVSFQGVAPTIGFDVFLGAPDGAQAYVSNEFADTFGGFGSTWEGLTVAIQTTTATITDCGFVNPTTFFIEFEPPGAGYRIISSSTLEFGNAVEVTPTLQPTSGNDNRFEFAASGSRKFYRLEPIQ